MISFIVRHQNKLMALLLLFITIFAIRLYPHPPLSDPLNFSKRYYDNNNQLIRMTLANDDRYRLWTPLEDISPDIVNGLLLHEDQWFYYHVGFNPFSLIRAFGATYLGGGNRQGASTITMQLARMHWRLNTKTIGGKLHQIARAIQLELMYSKHDILEAYLNYAPFGRNIESIGAASFIYFNKPPSQVNLPEALTLVVLPQSPTYRVDRKTGFAGKALVKARNQLFQRWQEKYFVDSNIVALFSQKLVLRQPERMPFGAPHFINQIIQQQQSNAQEIKTTLDNNLQKIISRQVNLFIERNRVKGINNASIILVDTQTMKVKALIGSANYFDNSIQGQVNGTLAKRSPGSTLKPFIYALGMDQGVLHPRTILKDVATDFGSYTPENFDRNFRGPISATDALIHSRNIPAVSVASKLHNPSFYQFLVNAHIQKLADESHYGLSLVLGGGEVTAQELVGLYAMLANEGRWQPLQFIEADDSPEAQKLLSPQAAFMTIDMLKQNTRPQDVLSKMQKKVVPVAWKTGTSWGFRDAWTAGTFGNYAMVVWLGNFDGSGNNAFVGVDAATPLFFNIVESINAYYPNLREPNRPLPPNLKRIDICLTSGNLLTQWCKAKGKTWFIPGVSPINPDTIFRPVMVDNQTGKAVCPPYDLTTSHLAVFEYWPSDLAAVFAKAGIAKKAPPSTKHCHSSQNFLGEPPKITSPLKNVVYQFRTTKQKNEQISFTANSDGDVKSLYWFVDNNFIGQTEPRKALSWIPTQSGTFKILVLDDMGRSDSRNIKIELFD
ncbi:penicillin-binding protein 1C [Gilliamella sp. Bif1-4]|jgi:penicillin-binding protein 1C|uniref:penicillin-binding protein 1C n=1 Tax=Gilliamella sp. Bif1-4 TaxID=3120233 RepID=UPI00080D8EF7|nr:penicillin-binding protein 1C [Gilliamella apicola]OCG39909.1 penicillin-binding protein 1C [Gilliamella apicola]